MTDRIAQIKARALRSYYGPDPRAQEAADLVAQVTEGDPEVWRQAIGMWMHCHLQKPTILPGELIVGTRPGYTSGPEEITPQIFGRREWTGKMPWWPMPEEMEIFWETGMLAPAGNHTTMDYTRLFELGFMGLRDVVGERFTRLCQEEGESEDLQRKVWFLRALIEAARAPVRLAEHYAEQAERLAAEEADPVRREELATIAGNCRRVPGLPPTTFWEACQHAWWCFYFLPDAPGRVDQYLYPCYERDLREGRITREFARELLACLWIKYFESVGPGSGVSAHNHLTLGGVKPDGSDASNEVTELCLEVTAELSLLRPQVGLRWNQNTPRSLLRKAVQVLPTGAGNPDFCSDEQIVPALHRIGVSLEDARDFSLSGCHEVIVTGKAQMGSVEGFINLPKVLHMVLGLEPALQDGADLAQMHSFEALWSRLEEAMEIVAEAAHQSSLGRDAAAAADPGGSLAASLVVQDCLEKCLGYTQGGARYNFCNWDVIGTANLVDSLAAIRALVFQERALTLPELVAVLESDWADAEPLRQRVINDLPHFGTGEPEVDGLARDVLARFDSILKRRTPYRGGVYILGTTAGGENMHIEFGRVTAATPDGRRRGQPLSDSIGAAQGRDRRGVTSLLNSVAGLPHYLLPTATTLNVKLDPALLRSDEGVDCVVALIDSHFRSGGQQLQFSFVNRQILQEAREHPERHRNLMVRVAGYSAPFTSLWADLQDEIIARTEHSMAS